MKDVCSLSQWQCCSLTEKCILLFRGKYLVECNLSSTSQQNGFIDAGYVKGPLESDLSILTSFYSEIKSRLSSNFSQFISRPVGSVGLGDHPS